MIRTTYDLEADALMVRLRSAERGEHVRTQVVTPGVHLDFDTAGHLLGLELLGASHHLPRETLAALPSPVQYLTLAEAAKESGLSPTTLRVQINHGRLKAVKRGRDWFVDSATLLNYLESREPRGRPPKAGRTRRGAESPRRARTPAGRSGAGT
jgi:uncharacterized protein YuzE